MLLNDGQLRVVFLDFWSDKNRGDAAMQIVQVKMLRSIVPKSYITVMAAFGANQHECLADELDETSPLVDRLVGGLRATFVPFGSKALEKSALRKILNILALCFGILMLPIWFLVGKTAMLDVFFPDAWRDSIKALRECDLVLWNGRNFRVDSIRREPYEIWNLLYNPVVALIFGKPIAAIGASIWSLRDPLARFLLRDVMGKAFFVSLREEVSMRNAKELLVGKSTRLELLPDLSLALLNEQSNFRDVRSVPENLNCMGVTVVDWVNSGESARQGYIHALCGFLKEFLKSPENSVVLIPQVTYDMEKTGGLEGELMRELDGNVTIWSGTPKVSELVNLYASLDFLVATRMHSAIFALSSGTPVVTIPYDVGGKWGILDMMGASDISVPFDSITVSALQSKVEEVWTRRSDILGNVRQKLPDLSMRVEDNLRIPLSIYFDTISSCK